MTMMLATHQIDFGASLADEIFFMEDGTFLEQGPPEKILNSAKCERTREFCAKLRELQGGTR